MFKVNRKSTKLNNVFNLLKWYTMKPRCNNNIEWLTDWLTDWLTEWLTDLVETWEGWHSRARQGKAHYVDTWFLLDANRSVPSPATLSDLSPHESAHTIINMQQHSRMNMHYYVILRSCKEKLWQGDLLHKTLCTITRWDSFLLVGRTQSSDTVEKAVSPLITITQFLTQTLHQRNSVNIHITLTLPKNTSGLNIFVHTIGLPSLTFMKNTCIMQ